LPVETFIVETPVSIERWVLPAVVAIAPLGQESALDQAGTPIHFQA
jgi:hypothetical protein